MRLITERKIIALTEECNFVVPILIGDLNVGLAYCDLGYGINLMPTSLFNTLGLGEPIQTTTALQLMDWSLYHTSFQQTLSSWIMRRIREYLSSLVEDFSPQRIQLFMLGLTTKKDSQKGRCPSSFWSKKTEKRRSHLRRKIPEGARPSRPVCHFEPSVVPLTVPRYVSTLQSVATYERATPTQQPRLGLRNQYLVILTGCIVHRSQSPIHKFFPFISPIHFVGPNMSLLILCRSALLSLGEF